MGYNIAYNNSNWEALYKNLSKAQRRWRIVLGVLVKSGATIRAMAMLYKAVVQAVLLYRSEIWVVKYVMIKVMKRLHHHISWRITGNTAHKFREEGWECPPHGGDP